MVRTKNKRKIIMAKTVIPFRLKTFPEIFLTLAAFGWTEHESELDNLAKIRRLDVLVAKPTSGRRNSVRDFDDEDGALPEVVGDVPSARLDSPDGFPDRLIGRRSVL